MVDIDQSILKQMIEAIVEEARPSEIYLLGSRARGDFVRQSDIDLLIVEPTPFGADRNRFEEINRLQEVLSSFRIPRDILVYSEEEFRKWAGSTNHIIGRCHREGKLLYARP